MELAISVVLFDNRGMRMARYDWLGWLGIVTILIAYAGITSGWLSLDGWLYPSLNLFGSVAVVVEAGSKKDYQPTILNLAWAAVALVGLARFLR